MAGNARPQLPSLARQIASLEPFRARHLTTDGELSILPRMMVQAHMRWHRLTVERTASAAVYLRLACDSSKRSPLFAQTPANSKEPGP
jgi:hypothetical protein